MKRKKVYTLENRKKKINISAYTHIRVYHACRPANIEEYLKNGIHDFTKEEVYNIARDKLMQCGIDEGRIKEVFQESWDESGSPFNEIYVNIFKDELMNESGHYLVYGSEFICGMAAQLFCQNQLKKIGVPTIFVCDVDINKFPQETIDCIENNSFYDGSWDGGICLRDNIEASEIVDYIQPKEMFDPLTWTEYRFIKY